MSTRLPSLPSRRTPPASVASVDAICGLSLLLVPPFALFSPLSPLSLKNHATFPNSNSTRNGRRRAAMWMCYLLIVI